jgi:hypothetical protein
VTSLVTRQERHNARAEITRQIFTRGLVGDPKQPSVCRRPVAKERISLGEELVGTNQIAFLAGRAGTGPRTLPGKDGLVEASTQFDEFLPDGPSFVGARGFVEQLAIGD